LKKFMSKGLIVFAGFLVEPCVNTRIADGADVAENDPRHHLLERFFANRNAPARAHVADFIKAADTNDLDWRLLPSIAHVESGGGKRFKNNNIFGWNNAEHRFPSIRAGIHAVADRLANSRLYKNKSLEALLRTYNANAEYAIRVKKVMRLIGPAEFPVYARY
jgi:hypothetical protein